MFLFSTTKAICLPSVSQRQTSEITLQNNTNFPFEGREGTTLLHLWSLVLTLLHKEQVSND